MQLPRLASAVLLAAIAVGSRAAETGDAGKVSAFLMRGGEGARTFLIPGIDEKAVDAAAREWVKGNEKSAATLAAVAAPGSTGEASLLAALARWNGKVARDAEVRDFLKDAAGRAEGLISNPVVAREIGAQGSSADQTAAIERARRLGTRRRAGSGVFGPDRDPGSLDGRSTDGRAPGGGAGSIVGGKSVQSPSQGLIAAGGGVGTGGTLGTAGATGIPAGAYLPAAQVPANFKTQSGTVPPPVVTMDPSDKRMNSVLSVVNMEAYSRKGTVNKESFEGSQAAICRFLIQAKYDPQEAWSLSKQARDKKDADPGDLDLRNAEHYLYAYSTTAKPAGIGDSTGVQLVMAAGWGGFKTVTKHFRPTSTPTVDETVWGIKGAWHGQHPPDWKSTCEPGKRAGPKAVSA